MELTFAEFFSVIGSFILVLAVSFVVIVVITSHARFQLLTHAVADGDGAVASPRRSLEIMIANLIGSMGRDAAPFVVMLLSVRSRREIGERHGPQVEEEVTSFVEGRIKDVTRFSDAMMRQEEHRTALLLRMPVANARSVAGRVLHRLQQEPYRVADGTSLRLDLAIGASAFPEDGDRSTLLYEKAHEAWTRAGESAGPLVLAAGDTALTPDQGPHHVGVEERGDPGLVDELTGVLRPERILHAMQRYVARYRRDELPAAVICMDIDHFKRYVGQYGREVTDEVLRQLSALIQKNFREEDVIGRGEGDAFTIGCAAADSGHALDAAKRVAAVIKKHSFDVNGTVLRLNVSCGVASAPEHGATGRVVLEAAETALRVAKAKGRNMCLLYESSMEGSSGPGSPADSF